MPKVKPSTPMARINLYFSVIQRERWQAAADDVGLTLNEWVRRALDSAAETAERRRARRK